MSPIEQKGEKYPLKTLTALRGFLAREIAQPIVFRLRVAALLVVEGWRDDMIRGRFNNEG